VCEVETQLTIANRLGYITQSETNKLVERACEVAKILNGLINSLKPGAVTAA
jgi:four helix bundle protein